MLKYLRSKIRIKKIRQKAEDLDPENIPDKLIFESNQSSVPHLKEKSDSLGRFSRTTQVVSAVTFLLIFVFLGITILLPGEGLDKFKNLAWLQAKKGEEKPIHASQTLVEIRAMGSEAGGVFAKMTLEIKGSRAKEWTTQNQWKSYFYNSSPMLNIEDIRISFNNDLKDSKKDRDLYVDWVKIGNLKFEVEEYCSLGSWDNIYGCNYGCKKSEILNCNGYFDFSAKGGN